MLGKLENGQGEINILANAVRTHENVVTEQHKAFVQRFSQQLAEQEGGIARQVDEVKQRMVSDMKAKG